MPEKRLRIGELSRRSGVSPELLRAWERRYGLLDPVRTASGYRLYTARDEERIAAMRAHLADGMSAAEAAALVLAGAGRAEEAADGGPSSVEDLWRALDDFDDAGAQAAFDALMATFSVETVLRTAVLPYLRTFGERWRDGDASVAQEHFATGVLRARLLGLARGWDRGLGPRAMLACPPGELHDLGLVVFGLALRDRGWRVTFLGSDTPIETLAAAAETLVPAAIVLAAVARVPFEDAEAAIAGLARRYPVWLAGAGSDVELANRTGARLLDGSPVDAAAGLTPAA